MSKDAPSPFFKQTGDQTPLAALYSASEVLMFFDYLISALALAIALSSFGGAL